MATTIKAPRVPPSPNSAAARYVMSSQDIRREVPDIISLTGALDALGCAAERLEELYRSTAADMASAIDEARLAKPDYDTLYGVWMIFLVANEKFIEMHEVIEAITRKVYSEKAEARS